MTRENDLLTTILFLLGWASAWAMGVMMAVLVCLLWASGPLSAESAKSIHRALKTFHSPVFECNGLCDMEGALQAREDGSLMLCVGGVAYHVKEKPEVEVHVGS